MGFPIQKSDGWDSCATAKSCASLTLNCFALRRTPTRRSTGRTAIQLNETPAGPHPLDMLEQAVEDSGWHFERAGRDELNLTVAGRWADHHFNFTWRDDLQSLHLSSAFDMRIGDDVRRQNVADLLMHVNAKLWIGDF